MVIGRKTGAPAPVGWKNLLMKNFFIFRLVISWDMIIYT